MKEKFLPILIVLLIGASFALGSMSTQLRQLKSTNQPQQQALGEQEANPETEVEAEERQVLDEQTWQNILTDADNHKGNPEAPIKIVEFSEYQCPYCARYVQQAYAQILTEYGDQVYYIFRDYPLPFHANTQNAALAARCAGEQDAYWEYHDLLFDNQDEWSELENPESKLASYAKELNLDVDQFNNCYISEKYLSAIETDAELASSVGVNGTPSFFINGQKLIGAQPFENFRAVIEAELNK